MFFYRISCFVVIAWITASPYPLSSRLSVAHGEISPLTPFGRDDRKKRVSKDTLFVIRGTVEMTEFT